MRAAKRDANQPEIVDALRAAGVTVIELGHIGSGVPDLYCYRKATGLGRWIEVKAPKGKLTKPQLEFHRVVPVWVVHSVAEALAAMDIGVAA